MKKIIKPKQLEEAIYFSDFTGKPFDQFGPPVILKIEFNYGSVFDQSEIVLHLSDDDINPILDVIRNNLNPDFGSIEEYLDKNIEHENN